MHSAITIYGQMTEITFWQSPLRPAVRLILPMFFALSGHLFAGGLGLSKTLVGLLSLRVIRIFLPLVVAVVLFSANSGPPHEVAAAGRAVPDVDSPASDRQFSAAPARRWGGEWVGLPTFADDESDWPNRVGDCEREWDPTVFLDIRKVRPPMPAAIRG